MSVITSLGIHRPTGLHHLDLKGGHADRYTCNTCVVHTPDGPIEEEVLFTSRSVVWSQATTVRAIHHFGLEDEDVRQAFLTNFPPHAKEKHVASEPAPDFHQDAAIERALVILLTTKLHIHYLHGSHHVIDLPFRVEKAMPAPRGVVFCRARTPDAQLQSTPRVPTAPPNSFFSSQYTIKSSYAHSPLSQKAQGKTQVSERLRNTGSDFSFENLWQTTTGTAQGQADTGDAIFTLADPFSEPGILTEVSQSPMLRLTGKRKASGLNLDPIDPAETVVYISNSDELASDDNRTASSPLILLVTVNQDRESLTLWHAWYLHERSLQALMQKSNEVKAEKSKRRSSFLSTSITTGATTPAIRNRDTFRESFVGTTQQISSATEEVTLASQLGPEFATESTQQSTKEVSRRISSHISRSDGPGVSSVNVSFGGSYRRGESFGGPMDRRSFGRRRSRESTPGSVLSRSFGVDDSDTMDLENESDFDLKETASETLHVIEASHDAVGSEALLGTLDEGWKRDLVAHRLHTFSLPSGYDSITSAEFVKFVTAKQSQSCAKGEDILMTVYLHVKSAGQLYTCDLRIARGKFATDPTMRAWVPVVQSCNSERIGSPIAKLSDGETTAVLLSDIGLRFPASDITCSIGRRKEHRIFNAMAASLDGAASKETRKNRIGKALTTPLALEHEGISGKFSELDSDGILHRQSIQLRPRDDSIDGILTTCEIVLPQEMACAIRPSWLIMYHNLLGRPELMKGTFCDAEAVAAAAVVFAQVLGLLDQKNKAALRIARVAASNRRASYKHGIVSVQQHDRLVSINARTAWSKLNAADPASQERDQAPGIAIALADEISTFSSPPDVAQNALVATKLILGLHITQEERKLNVATNSSGFSITSMIISQLGSWLNNNAWSSKPGTYYELGGAATSHWHFIKSTAYVHGSLDIMEVPIGVPEWLEHSIANKSAERYPTLPVVTQLGLDVTLSESFMGSAGRHTARIEMLCTLLITTAAFTTNSQAIVEAMKACRMTVEVLESLPEGISAPLKEAIAQCERDPPSSWTADLLHIVGRDDLVLDDASAPSINITPTILGPRDIQTVAAVVEMPAVVTKTREADRNAVSQLIFNRDRRLVDATSMLHYNTVQVAECQKQPDWTDAVYFEQQKKIMQFVTVRMIALPIGDGMLHFDSQSPLMTDKYYLPGFSSSCIMQPIGHTVTTDRSGLTEDKVNWAYFHAGVSAGLRLSKDAKGIDTSWLMFNKPAELTNRHAGLLLALGLNGHLRQLAKWLSFKYLSPKHNMTSLGLLLGLAASHIGSMDGLITRMLSVHISCMLPPGATELNVSPQTQTAGLLGIGLLYYNTQHRRMSETMLQEIESIAIEDPDCGPDSSKDESYRLAAGFALGFINLGHGKDLRGLHGLQIQQRLLRVAVGSRPVHAVHVMDKAIAGATMAIAMMYMKSGDIATARQIDVPDTEAQFEHVRPDILMLRSLAKHIILWDGIETLTTDSDRTDSATWISANLPKCYWKRWSELSSTKTSLKSSDLPFYYIVTGLALAMSLKYAGTGHKGARNEILTVLDILWVVQKRRGDGHYFYDTIVTRSAIRRCIDVVALAAATVMSGTGDLFTFRYLRRLHGRTDAETPYGSHLAAHMAIGILFMAGGTATFGTSDLAIASLLVSLYPLFPVDVHDNKVHLQAFRHLWVFAAESRCLIVEDIHAGRPLQVDIMVTMLDGESQVLHAPCLLPESRTIKTISTRSTSHWPVVLDLRNPEHVRRLGRDCKIIVRHCPPSEAHNSAFWSTFSALTMPAQVGSGTIRDWVFSLLSLEGLDRSDIELILRAESNNLELAGTKVDDELTMKQSAGSDNRDRLWDVRVLLAWAKRVAEGQISTRWYGRQYLAKLECEIEARQRANMA